MNKMQGPLKFLQNMLSGQPSQWQARDEIQIDSLRRRILMAFIISSPLIIICPLMLPFGAAPASLPNGSLVGLLFFAISLVVLIMWTQRYRVFGIIYLAMFQLFLCMILILNQSIHSIHYPLLPACIIVAALIFGMKGAAWYSVFCVSITVACIEFNARHGLKLPAEQDMVEFASGSLVSLLAVQVFLLVLALSHDSFRRRQQAFLTAERNRISQSLYNYALGELVGSVSHEVNNPLAIMSAIYIRLEKMASAGMDTDELANLHEKVERALERIRYVVNGLKLFAHGALEEKLEQKSVLSICQFLRELNQETMIRLGMELHFEDLTQNLTFPCRYQQLIRSLNGLIRNATDATAGKSGGRIDVRIFRSQHFLTFQVSDNGNGVPEELREHLFEPFFSTKDLQAGQGLTLAVSRGLIEAQGGHLIYTPLAVGSSFSILLPVVSSHGQGERDHVAHAVPNNSLFLWALGMAHKVPGHLHSLG